MMNKIEYQIPEWKEIDTFILHLPKLKQNQIENAVKFELMSVYPGNIDECTFGYYQNESNILGFVAPSGIKEKYKGKRILSPIILIQQNIKNGIVLLEYENAYDLLEIENYELKSYSRFTSRASSRLTKKIADLITEKPDARRYIWKIKSCLKNETNDFLLDRSFEEINPLEKDLSAGKITKASLFSSKKNNSLFYVYVSVTCLVFLLFLILVLSFSSKEKKSLQEVNAKKAEYESIKTEMTMNTTVQPPSGQPSQKIQMNESFSQQYIFTKLNNSGLYIKLTSLSINNDTFRIEGTCSNSISLSKFLSSDQYLSDIELHQTINTEEGNQKFVLTGRYKYD